MKKCLVTGATGFLGTNLVNELVKQGYQVRASGSRAEATPYLIDMKVEYVAADITDAAQCLDLVKGCDTVFHVAGDTSFWKPLYARQRQINVEGSRNIAEACVKNCVRRQIHTSTADVFGYSEDGQPVDELTGYFNYLKMGYNYGETKNEADSIVRRYKSPTLDVILIHPGFMVGAFDHTLQIGSVFFELKEGKIPAMPPGGSSFCDVTEVAKAHIVAAIRGRNGESYICAGMPHSNLSLADMFSRMAEAIAIKPPKLVMPYWAWVAYAYGCEFAARFTGEAPQINPGQARYMGHHQKYDSSKAMAELDYKVPPVEDSINAALSWYRQHGYQI